MAERDIELIIEERDRYKAALGRLAKAAIAYDEAIQGCANEPNKMASFCSAEGDTLDSLYLKWVTLARNSNT